MINYALILAINYEGKKWTLNGDSYEGLNWLDESSKPTEEELNALWESTQIALNNERVDTNRKKAYANEADPLFFKSQRGEATIEEWQAKITEIKLRYPKS
jgi:hypothetical protein